MRDITKENLEDLLFLGMIGVILGGRLGFVLFYQPEYYLRHPLQIFAVWQGGMSAHGGFIGVILAICYFAWRKKEISFDCWRLCGAAGSAGLFLRPFRKLYQRGVVGKGCGSEFSVSDDFPQAEDNNPRHPSQLYEATAEGLILFLIVWIYSTKARPRGAVSGLFFLVYGVGRFIVEFFREPDSYLGLQALSLSRGQWLCIPLIAAGIGLMAYAYLKKEKA